MWITRHTEYTVCILSNGARNNNSALPAWHAHCGRAHVAPCRSLSQEIRRPQLVDRGALVSTPAMMHEITQGGLQAVNVGSEPIYVMTSCLGRARNRCHGADEAAAESPLRDFRRQEVVLCLSAP